MSFSLQPRVHFDLQMRFSLQRRAIFSHHDFKKWSKNGVFCTFWLANVLLATAACNFSTSRLPKSGPLPSVFWHFDFEMSFSLQRRAIFHFPLNSYLRTRRFAEPTFRLSWPTNHWKNTAFRDFPNSSHVCSFCLLTFAQLYLLSSDSTSLLCFSSSDSTALLCFFNSPYCRKSHF